MRKEEEGGRNEGKGREREGGKDRYRLRQEEKRRREGIDGQMEFMMGEMNTV